MLPQMQLSEDATASVSHRLWLDRWFAPRWRALLTWMLLVALVVFWRDLMVKYWGRYFAFLGRYSPVALPPSLYWPAFDVNLALAWVWFEPFALRLNLRRGVAWVILRLAPAQMSRYSPFILWNILPIPYLWCEQFWPILSGAALALVLRGWRTRPWMPILCWALLLAASTPLNKLARVVPGWLACALLALPFAIPLLYGTRLLTPWEREQQKS
jgi:hypothetical protein